LAERRSSPVSRIAFALMMIALGLVAIETAMRYRNWPPSVFSGWRISEAVGPVNQFGWRGQPPRRRGAGTFLVVMTGGAAVECLACPPDETLDLMLERSLHQYNPDVRVVTLGSTGYAQDQEFLALHEYLAHERADLIIDWASIAQNVPANTFRSGHPGPGRSVLKPSFALDRGNLRGPTEGLGQPIYKTKLTTLLRPLLIDADRNWTTLLPKPDPGAATPPPGIDTRSQVEEPLEQQRSAWSIWLTPRPVRVEYGIELTHVLLTHMQALATLRGAHFAVLLTPAADRQPTVPVALEHAGHWYVADPTTRDAAITQVTDGLDTITLPLESDPLTSPEAERLMMTRLAQALNQRGLLVSVAFARERH
jgi:hypothetical protein